MPLVHSIANSMLSLVQGSTTYLGLLKSLPNQSGLDINEVNGVSYARQHINFSTPINSLMSNTSQINFPQANELWGTIVAFGIFDSLSGGNLIWYGSFPNPATLSVGSYFFITPGGISLSLGL